MVCPSSVFSRISSSRCHLCLVLVVLGLVLALFRWRKTGLVLALAGVAWAYAWSLPVTTLWLGGILESEYPYRAPAELPTADAIVVLGGNIANDRLNWFLPYDRETAIRRFQTAEQLYDAGRAPKIVLSGGALRRRRQRSRGHGARAAPVRRAAQRDDPGKRQPDDLRERHPDGRAVEGARHPYGAAGDLRPAYAACHGGLPQAGRDGDSGAVATAWIVLPASPRISPWLPDERAFDASRSIIKEYTGLFLYWLRGWI